MIRKLILSTFLAAMFSLPANAATPGISANNADGAVIVGPDANTCDSTIQGAIRYTSTTNALSYCNGSSWTSMGGTVQLPTQATMTTCNSGNIGVMRFNTGNSGGSTTTSAPTIATYSTQVGSGGAVSVARPTGLTAGDLLIMSISSDNAAAWTWPSGFTDIGSGLIGDAGGTDGQTLGVAWKIATGSEPANYTTTITAGSLSFAATVMRITGAVSASPISAYNYAALTSGTATPVTVNAPSITPATNNNLILWIATGDGTNTGNYSYTVPSGMTHAIGPTNNGVWSSLEVATLAQTTAAATGVLSGSVALPSATNLAYIVFSLAVKPSGVLQSSTYVEVCDGSSWAIVGR